MLNNELDNLEHEEIMSSDCLEDAMAKADEEEDMEREDLEMARMDAKDIMAENKKNADEDDGAFDDHDVPAEPEEYENTGTMDRN
jgi:hypothetical protein